MEGDSNPVDRAGLKRKLDDTESPSEQEDVPSTSTICDTIDLNMPVVDSVLDSSETPASQMELQDSDLMTQDIPVSIDTLNSDQLAEETLQSESQPSGLGDTAAQSGNLLVPQSEEPTTTTVSEAQPLVLAGLELPSLDASLPISSTDTPELISTPTEPPSVTDELSPTETNITIKHEENITIKHDENITIKHEEIDIKHELPLSVGPSDEALISECEKLLEENREFEKSQMDHEQDDNDDQHSSDTVSVDSDTAKAQEDDFKDEPMDVDAAAPKLEQSPMKQEDPLSTLASAALGIKTSSVIKTETKDVKKKTTTPWCDVGIFNSPSCIVTGFYANQETNEYSNVNSNILPPLDDLPKLSLDPGTAYKFRVCAVNSCGRGPWSEVSAFRTCLPGFPGAPSSIKISKSPEGANISWHPPSSPSGNIIEYSVCLAIKKFNHRNEEIKPNPAALTFEKVYSGPSNHAIVSHAALNSAYVDTTNKPAIIFRIAAKNEKGYGPATQVRWLQDGHPKK